MRIIGDWIERLLAWLRVERHDIGRPGVGTYLTRWVLIGARFGDGKKVFLHLFHRSDHEDLHDHPWPFTSIILWGGYWEYTECKTPEEIAAAARVGQLVTDGQERLGDNSFLLRPPVLRRRWYGPGRILRRPAEWQHRVMLPPGRRCWTLVFPGKKVRSWGFICSHGWIPWREHAANIEAGKPGCGE